jgi:leucyl/phenylalanyl-tRNA--protein transferase
MNPIPLDPDSILAAYSQGAFPMTNEDGQTHWYTADPRGILPLDEFHIPRTLAQFLRRQPPVFEVRINCDFEGVIRACAGRPRTWISEDLIAAYLGLHDMGRAHSVETWRGGELVGGLYGVALGAAFFGESMFHRQTHASKVALVALVDRLRERKFELLDAQAVTPHLKTFGGIEIAADHYLRKLQTAIRKKRRFC